MRPAPARAHPSLHARPPAPRDRAGHRRAVPALPRLLAARRSRASARRPARRRRGRRAARRLRDPGGGLGGQRPAGARARLPARVARPADALGRGRVGTPLGRGASRRSAATPIALVPRDDLDAWTALACRTTARPIVGDRGARCYAALRSRGAMFVQEIAPPHRAPRRRRRGGPGGSSSPPGRVTCDSFGGLRWLVVPACAARASRV